MLAGTPKPSDKPEPSDKPLPSDKPQPSDKPEPSDKPLPSDKPQPSDTPKPSAPPGPKAVDDKFNVAPGAKITANVIDNDVGINESTDTVVLDGAVNSDSGDVGLSLDPDGTVAYTGVAADGTVTFKYSLKRNGNVVSGASVTITVGSGPGPAGARRGVWMVVGVMKVHAPSGDERLIYEPHQACQTHNVSLTHASNWRGLEAGRMTCFMHPST